MSMEQLDSESLVNFRKVAEISQNKQISYSYLIPLVSSIYKSSN